MFACLQTHPFTRHCTEIGATEAAGSATFLLRTDEGEVTESHAVLREIFRELLARLWQAAFRETPRP